ncbi:MAG: hypothetical protein H7222_08800 [Methylotenera sp.]|nr:hypothetical protein [Oligoflexia bacterium]
MSNQRVFSYYRFQQRMSRPLSARIALLSLGCAEVSLAFSSQAMATTGFVRLESDGFLKRSDDRSNSTQTIVLGPEFSGQNRFVEGNADLQAIGYVTNKSTFTAESKNAYLATSTQLMPRHQLTLGRRQYDWSVVDDQWKMGLWSPRFLWDPLRPEQIGLTGAFYTYQSQSWRVLAYASPLSIPERGFPTQQQDGRITSASPFYIEPFQKLQITENRSLPVHYDLQYPAMSELLLNPGGAMQVRYGEKQGGWIQANYGILPILQPNLSIEPSIVLQSNEVEVTVHPRILYHHVMTGETGFKNRDFSLWSSVTGETPLQKQIPSSWVTIPIGPTLIVSAGAEANFRGGFKLNGSLFYLNETTPAQTDAAVDTSSLQGRFEYKKAARLGAEWSGMTHLTYSTAWIADLEEKSNLMSFDLNFRPKLDASLVSGAWLINVGTDFFTSSTGTGHLGKYQGNDRVRGGVSYVF